MPDCGMPQMDAGPVLLLDSASLYYRSYYALPESMQAPDGHPHNAIRGFFSTIARLRQRFSPSGLVAAWDTDWRPQWRVDLIPSYKTHRVATEDDLQALEETPDTLGPQIGAIHELLDAWGVPVVGAEGYEADDIIATLAKTYDNAVVVSGDRDMVQVVSESTRVFLAVNGGMEKWPLLDPGGVRERYGITPDQYVEVAAMRGDPSDGLPGVPGIGEKTATKLITEFGGLHEVLVAAADGPVERPLTPRLAELLNTHADYLDAAVRVSTAATDVALPKLSPLIPNEPARPKALEQLCAEWGVTRQVHEALDLAN